ncbi:MAG: type II secretion system protein J [Opitutales bacterium]
MSEKVISTKTPHCNAQSAGLVKNPGFTLLEVLFAITVTGFVLTAAVAFLVSVSSIWMERGERQFFEKHVDGVTEFLRASFADAGGKIVIAGEWDEGNQGPGEDTSSSPENSDPDNNRSKDDPSKKNRVLLQENSRRTDVKTGGNRDGTRPSSARSENGNSDGNDSKFALLHKSDDPVSWERPPGFSESRDPFLSFILNKKPALLQKPGIPSFSGIACFLHFDRNEGLSLLWYAGLQEEAENPDDLHRTRLSSLVREIRYVYWDDRFERWETTERPERDETGEAFKVPRYLRLVFEHDGETTERTLAIPAPSKSALIY